MKCDQAGTWLLMSDAPNAPSQPVARHLQNCASCRETQQRLVQLETNIAELCIPAQSNDAKQRFLSKIDRLPLAEDAVTIRSQPSTGRQPLQRRHFAYIGGAAAALVLAFLLGWTTSSLQNRPDEKKNVAGQQGSKTDDGPGKNKTPVEKEKESPLVVQDDGPDEKKTPAEKENDAPLVVQDDGPDEKKTPAEKETDVPLVIQNDGPKIDPQLPRESPQPRASSDKLALLRPLIDNHIRLATADSPEDRFALVSQLSDVLWQEVVRNVEAGPTSELLLLDQMYDQVVSRSLPSRSRRLERDVEPTRRRIAGVLAARQTEAKKMARGTVPAVGEILLHIGDRSNRSAQWIAAGEVPDVTALSPSPVASHDLSATVVARSLRLAEEDDPLERARQSSEVADHLSRTIVFTSLRGDEETSEELGSYLGDVVELGVMVNLSRFDSRGADDARLAEYERIKQHSQHSVVVLRRNLERAPEPARKGLRRALEAKQRGRGKGPPHGKGPPPGKGPPHSKGGGPGNSKKFIPPGLRRKKPKG